MEERIKKSVEEATRKADAAVEAYKERHAKAADEAKAAYKAHNAKIEAEIKAMEAADAKAKADRKAA